MSISITEPSCLDNLGDYAARITDFTKTLIGTSFDPVKHTLYFFCPSFGAYWLEANRAYETDPAQDASMPLSAKQIAIIEINRLAQFANLGRPVILYTKPLSPFFSYGGSFSLSSPVLFAPHEHIFRVGHPSFGSEAPQDNLQGRLWHFSDHEVRFLITRELGRMKYNEEALRVIAKVIVISINSMLWFSPITLIATVATYLFFSYKMEYHLDTFSVKTLARALNISQEQSKQIALSTLQKMRGQNIDHKRNYWFDSFFVTSSGNDLRNFLEPPLTSRISELWQ